MKIYPILNNLGKGKYVFIFILNERAVRRGVSCRGCRSREEFVTLQARPVNSNPGEPFLYISTGSVAPPESPSRGAGRKCGKI